MPSQLRALDLFSGAGGATRGLQLAGFDVTGVDIDPQPRYCGDRFVQAEALSFLQAKFATICMSMDLIWASPPCQAHTSLKSMHNAKKHIDLIAPTRALLQQIGVPYVIENVVGAPLINYVTLCGTMFDLRTDGGAALHRHRNIEASFHLPQKNCRHSNDDVIGIYGGHYRNRKRKSGLNREAPDFTPADGRRAMGIDFMTGAELSQAIPPAYSKWVAEQFLAQRRAAT